MERVSIATAGVGTGLIVMTTGNRISAFGAGSRFGLLHAEFGPGGLRREWTLFDEAAVWMQIHCATGNLIERRQGQQLAAV